MTAAPVATFRKPHAIPADVEDLFHTGRFTVGDSIRAYDFAGMTDSYIEGKVLNPFCNRDGIQCYEIAVTARVLGGELTYKRPALAYIPHEVFWSERPGRIEPVLTETTSA